MSPSKYGGYSYRPRPPSASASSASRPASASSRSRSKGESDAETVAQTQIQMTRAVLPVPSLPQAAPAAPAPQGPSLSSVVVEGMAFGVGTAVAGRAVDAVAGPRQVKVEHVSAMPTQPLRTGLACASEREGVRACVEGGEAEADSSACRLAYHKYWKCQNAFVLCLRALEGEGADPALASERERLCSALMEKSSDGSALEEAV